MTFDYIISKRNTFKGLVVDTNLLLLLMVGLYDHTAIGKVKRTEKFSQDDFQKLTRLLNHFKTNFIINTNILTELCNLTESFNNKTEQRFFAFIKSAIVDWKEEVKSASETLKEDEKVFFKFGMTDASIFQLAKEQALVVTDDLKLYHYLSTQNFYTLNYTNLMIL